MTIILGILGTVTAASVLALVAKLAHSAGLAQKAGTAVQSLPAVDVHTKSATFNEAVDAAGNTVESILKDTLTGDALDKFLAFMATGPSQTQVITYLETNFGASLLTKGEAALPPLLKAELGILGHSLPGVLGTLFAKYAPDVAANAAASIVGASKAQESLKTIVKLPSGATLVKPATQGA